jgi:hypothetical protein
MSAKRPEATEPRGRDLAPRSTRRGQLRPRGLPMPLSLRLPLVVVASSFLPSVVLVGLARGMEGGTNGRSSWPPLVALSSTARAVPVSLLVGSTSPGQRPRSGRLGCCRPWRPCRVGRSRVDLLEAVGVVVAAWLGQEEVAGKGEEHPPTRLARRDASSANRFCLTIRKFTSMMLLFRIATPIGKSQSPVLAIIPESHLFRGLSRLLRRWYSY